MPLTVIEIILQDIYFYKSIYFFYVYNEKS